MEVLENVLETIEISPSNSGTAFSEFAISTIMQQRAITALESGRVVFFPSLPFQLSPNETRFLAPSIVDPKSKNISYDLKNDKLGGTLCRGSEALELQEMIKRYAVQSRRLLERLFPRYVPYIIQARTSFRPVEASGRISSYRKDDTRLHVDSFPATPTKGQRILRFFTNVNPHGKPRVWRLGEPFIDVVDKMAPRVSKPLPGFSSFLQALKVTKDYRTLYDHYMLKMHDTMKGDEDYQKYVRQQEVHFPAGSTWMVYSDQVSHAAMSGQHMFEQTFHLPPQAMQDESTTPLRVLEKFFKRKLVD